MDDTDKSVSGPKRAWCSTWSFAVNRPGVSKSWDATAWPVRSRPRSKTAERLLGERSFQALERGETIP